jgi:succinoglycan biosynthesis protein ExoA
MTVRVLVVIPTLNEAHGIARVLSDLSLDLPASASTTFVVADGGSTDGTDEIVRSLVRGRDDLHFLLNPKRMQGAAVNLAAREFGRGADVLVRCDAHAAYPPGYVRRLLEALQQSAAGAVVVPMDSEGDTCTRRAIAWVSDTPIGSGGSAHRGGHASGFVDHGHHAAFRMTSFIRAGGYDESFSHNEDAELDCRQRALGTRIFLDTSIRVGYEPRGSLGGLWRQYMAYGRGRSRTVRKHPSSLRFRQLVVPAHLALTGMALLVAARAPVLLCWPALYLVLLSATSILLAMSHRSFCALLSGPAAFVMHTAWAMGFFWGLLSIRERRWRPEAAAPLSLDDPLGESA